MSHLFRQILRNVKANLIRMTCSGHQEHCATAGLGTMAGLVFKREASRINCSIPTSTCNWTSSLLDALPSFGLFGVVWLRESPRYMLLFFGVFLGWSVICNMGKFGFQKETNKNLVVSRVNITILLLTA